MDNRSKSTLSHAWQAQIRQLAARNPRLARALWQNRQVYFERFVHFYRRLANLPRKLRRKFLKRLATTLAGAALLLALGQALPARAAMITVDGVTCTLADGINAANTDTATGGCVAGSGADVIDLQTDVTLSASLPDIESEMTLEGNGHTIDGNDSFQVLDVDPGGNLTLNEATITGGNASFGGGIINGSGGTLTINNSTVSGNSASYYGGGIANFGTLTLNASTLSGNSADSGGGIVNGGTLTLNASILSGNSSNFRGGGIYAYYFGTVTLNNTTLSGNSSNAHAGGIFNGANSMMILNGSILSDNSATTWGGGGIQNEGTLSINNSTLSGNVAGSGGGGIYNSGTLMVSTSVLSGNSASYGGGIFNRDSTGLMTLTNSTLSGNSAATSSGGGIFNFRYGTVTLNNSTLSGNSAQNYGGGIYNALEDGPSILILNQCLVSGNSASLGGAEVDNRGTITVNNYNVIGYDGDAHSNGFVPGANDIVPPGALDTVLNTTLADNGGPTLTHALVSGSAALDTAPDAECTAAPISGLDQRSFPRNVDGDGTPSANECDTGAFEYDLSGFKVYLPLIVRASAAQASPAPTPAAFPFLHVLAALRLALGHLFFF